MNLELTEYYLSLSQDKLSAIISKMILNQKNQLNDFSTFCMLGKYYLNNDQLNKALFYYSCALKLKQSSDLSIIIGTLYHALGQSRKAKYCLQKANALNSDINMKTKMNHVKKIKRFKRDNHRFSCIIR